MCKVYVARYDLFLFYVLYWHWHECVIKILSVKYVMNDEELISDEC